MGPLEDTPDPSQTVSGGICFFLAEKGSLGSHLPREEMWAKSLTLGKGFALQKCIAWVGVFFMAPVILLGELPSLETGIPL